ncbi:MAG: NADH-quinone oxidoreductase subunit NuoK [Planctomycetes bacterium]|nr:NADH-quinone oxidoreductase subunit NuoK [Planctomycetota bacterium]
MNDVNEAALLHNYLLVGMVLFVIGMTGFLIRRNLIVMFLCVEMMLQGISLSLAAWGRYHNDWGGQMMILFIIAVASCEAAIALTLVLVVSRRTGNLDVAVWQDLREEGELPFVDRELPEETTERPQSPVLPPAGRQPDVDEDELMHRSHV